MKLYSYWRSTTSYRVRAALNLKRLDYELVPVDLLAGEQRSTEYTAINPGKGVPTLVCADGTVLNQSMAILDYLDRAYPDHYPLLPDAPVARARVLAAANVVACDIHPVNNLRVVGRLKSEHGASPQQATQWMLHWMAEGFSTLEVLLAHDTKFAFASKPDLADICITAQVYNARRWGLDLDLFPRVRRVETACLNVPEIAAAHPDAQPESKGDL